MKKAFISMLVAAMVITNLFSVTQVAEASANFHAYRTLMKTSQALKNIDSFHYFTNFEITGDLDENLTSLGLQAYGDIANRQNNISANVEFTSSESEASGFPDLNLLHYDNSNYFKLNNQNNFLTDYLPNFPENQWITDNDYDWSDYQESYDLIREEINLSDENQFTAEQIFSDLVMNNVIVFDDYEFGPIMKNHKTYAISYHFNFSELTEYIEREIQNSPNQSDAKMIINTFEEFEKDLSITGEIFISTFDFLPRKITLNIQDLTDQDDIQINLSIELSQYNWDVDFLIPENAMTITELEQIMEQSYEYQPSNHLENLDLTTDSDNDGLSDYHENYIYHTDKFNPDSDGDGYPDGLEVANGYSPTGLGRL